MDKNSIKDILLQVSDKKISVDEALEQLKILPYKDLGFVKFDTHRELRKDFPEVVYCRGKTIGHILAIISEAKQYTDSIMATKVTDKIYKAIRQQHDDVEYFELAQIALIGKKRPLKNDNVILTISAGTADIPVAEEAAITAEIMGNNVRRLYDVGVAGLHRLLDNLALLNKAHVLIVVAGMEGALVSVVSGLVSRPVIAVPTSVGYGANFNGISALLAMLNSCSPGVSVVNIDNGFGAGYLASIINS